MKCCKSRETCSRLFLSNLYPVIWKILCPSIPAEHKFLLYDPFSNWCHFRELKGDTVHLSLPNPNPWLVKAQPENSCRNLGSYARKQDFWTQAKIFKRSHLGFSLATWMHVAEKSVKVRIGGWRKMANPSELNQFFTSHRHIHALTGKTLSYDQRPSRSKKCCKNMVRFINQHVYCMSEVLTKMC